MRCFNILVFVVFMRFGRVFCCSKCLMKIRFVVFKMDEGRDCLCLVCLCFCFLKLVYRRYLNIY